MFIIIYSKKNVQAAQQIHSSTIHRHFISWFLSNGENIFQHNEMIMNPKKFFQLKTHIFLSRFKQNIHPFLNILNPRRLTSSGDLDWLPIPLLWWPSSLLTAPLPPETAGGSRHRSGLDAGLGDHAGGHTGTGTGGGGRSLPQIHISGGTGSRGSSQSSGFALLRCSCLFILSDLLRLVDR